MLKHFLKRRRSPALLVAIQAGGRWNTNSPVSSNKPTSSISTALLPRLVLYKSLFFGVFYGFLANDELKSLDVVISQLEARVDQMRANLQEEAAVLQTTSVYISRLSKYIYKPDRMLFARSWPRLRASHCRLLSKEPATPQT